MTLKQAVELDYVCAEFRENRRSIENFVRCDCLAFDVDNDHSDIPAEWILPKDVAEFFSGVTFWVHFSRSNMKEKNGKEPRPKFHVFFPIRECRSAQQCASLKQAVQRIFPYFDEQALDAARFFFGTEDPEVEYWEGIRDLTEFLEKRGIGAALRGDYVPIARKGTAAYAPGASSEQIINGTTKYDPKKPSPGGEGGSERSPASSETDEVTPRNHYAEWQELAEAHPEVVGKELPEDIYQECMRSELPPIRVYESMMLQKQAEQISALQQEIAMLRQNAENTARAPV